jgi:hypothetical protein
MRMAQEKHVFISYSHKDDAWLEKLLTMLKPMVRNKTVAVWYDKRIRPSQEWRQEIDNAMSAASVGILLVTKHFLASDFIADNELPYLIEAAKSRGVKLLWILVSPCAYPETDLERIQAVNRNLSKPLARCRGSNLDDELLHICNEIKATFACEIRGREQQLAELKEKIKLKDQFTFRHGLCWRHGEENDPYCPICYDSSNGAKAIHLHIGRRFGHHCLKWYCLLCHNYFRVLTPDEAKAMGIDPNHIPGTQRKKVFNLEDRHGHDPSMG